MLPEGQERVSGKDSGTNRPTPEGVERIVTGLLENRPEVVETVSGWVGSVARHRAWGFDSADDIVQDALLCLLRNLKNGSFAGGDLRAYVRRITKNLCVSSYRKMRVRGVMTGLSDIPYPSSIGGRSGLESGAMVHRILASLDEPCREIITLAYLHGMSRREIAERYQISEGTAKVRLFRCLEKARARQGRGALGERGSR